MSSMTIRRWHSYIGLFIAPSVIFFALTGAVQIYSLHEAHGTYHPAAIIEKLSSVHKDQVFSLGHHHEPSAPEPAGDVPAVGAASAAGGSAGKPIAGKSPAAAADDDKPELLTDLLKGFFLLVALCLTFSTAFGVWMGLTQMRRGRLAWLLLLSGAVIPLVLSLL